ncbi:related to Aromatic-L-amino-acid decarboxylase [Ustilago trichophora]|uniref:Related to Aromatic-L-amino-acid decarboxylase n=1 Tax=Ustilago trichophora TaxID=86804 RepID=A0A5C3EPA0_9BASI|nr:related to Aromatic-L-amino-acid decarboxylase [Ustilago trichophora]
MDIEGFRKAGYAAVDRICDYYSSLSSLPVSSAVQPGFLSSSIPLQPPTTGEEWKTIDNDYHNIIMPGITHWQHPNFYGYFPCNASFEGAIADLYCASISNPGFNWSVSPSVTELEILMVDWVGRMLGLDEEWLSTSKSGTGGGIILGSASEVAVTVAIAARERCIALLADEFPMPNSSTEAHGGQKGEGLDADQNVAMEGKTASQIGQESTPDASSQMAEWRGKLTSKLVMYGTTQTHTIAAKAALILGLDFKALPVSAPNYSLSASTLRTAIEQDTAQGRIPFMLIATIGTTSSGAIDDISSLIQVARDYPTLWLHIDAAYAGVCLSIPEMRSAMHLDAINSGAVDSFSTNLHKWGLVQFDCSPLLVRDRGHLSRALTITPAYLKTKQGDAGNVLDLRNLQISLGRRFRSLKIWFVLRSFGVQGFQAHLKTTMECAKVFEDNLKADDSGLFEIVAPPRWALVVFRIKPPSDESGGNGEGGQLDELNKAFWEDLQELSDKFVLTQTSLPGVGFCVRFVVGSPQTRREHVEETWQLVAETGKRTWARFSGGNHASS